MRKTQPEAAGLDRRRLERIGIWMQRYVDERKFAGASVLIARGGQEVYFDARGQRNIARDLDFTRDTVVRLYSMTKPITTLAAMCLIERGMFHLDAPASEFIPAFSDMRSLIKGAERLDQVEPCAVPTIHQLMTHTSGLSYPFNPGVLPRAMDEGDLMFRPAQGNLADMAERVAALPLAFHPGKRWEYSVGIDILGRVIEVVSGQSLDKFLREHILGPLGMTQTAFRVPKATGERFAALYTPLAGDAMALNTARKGDDSLRLADAPGSSPFECTTLFSGGGGLVGTIDDYMQFAEYLRSGMTGQGARIVGPRTLEFMMRNHLPGDIASMGPQSFAEQPMQGMGFGLGGAVVIDPARTRAPSSVGDFSWGGMASTFFWVDRAQDLSVVFFTQLAPSSAYPARPQLKALVQGTLT
ncbi:serine hydrolase domain-containing protein [Pontibaca salina]|nr:serine hydrolase domain-containing protein [Pontibaca salina]